MKTGNKAKLRKNALEEIKSLFLKAKQYPSKADNYVKKARKLGMKVNLSIPKELKRKYCKHCNSYFRLGNYRVRTRNKMIVYSCFKCRKYTKVKIG